LPERRRRVVRKSSIFPGQQRNPGRLSVSAHRRVSQCRCFERKLRDSMMVQHWAWFLVIMGLAQAQSRV
jgi:hypothetical protein